MKRNTDGKKPHGLHACWFCGYDGVKIHARKTTQGFTRENEEGFSASVRCPRCHARGPTARFTQPFSTEWPTPIPEEVGSEAARLWNNIIP